MVSIHTENKEYVLRPVDLNILCSGLKLLAVESQVRGFSRQFVENYINLFNKLSEASQMCPGSFISPIVKSQFFSAVKKCQDTKLPYDNIISSLHKPIENDYSYFNFGNDADIEKLIDSL